MSARTLIIVPTLNEGRHIGSLLDGLLAEAEALGARIVVADGGSIDDTRAVVAARAATASCITLLDNPRRIQSAAINLAVERFGRNHQYLIRIDAHGSYPIDYCRRLVA